MRSATAPEPGELGGTDPLDGIAAHGRAPLSLRAPTLLFIPIGVALGPAAAGIVRADALINLEPVFSAALAALGIYAGLGFDVRTTPGRRLLLAASAEAVVTMALVAVGCAVLMRSWALPLSGEAWIWSGVLAVCASASAPGQAASARARVAAHIADLDDAVPLVVGAVLMAMAVAMAPGDTLVLLGSALAVGTAVAAAGWMLFERAHGEAERGVFVAGAVLLLGGAARELGASPLVMGAVAGLIWRVSPGGADLVITGDLRRFQHPLVALLLIGAGALVEPSLAGWWLVVPFVLFRTCGKLLGSLVAARTVSGLEAVGLASHLFAPGVLGIAFALAFAMAVPTSASATVLFAVVAGSVVMEVAALLTGSEA